MTLHLRRSRSLRRPSRLLAAVAAMAATATGAATAGLAGAVGASAAPAPVGGGSAAGPAAATPATTSSGQCVARSDFTWFGTSMNSDDDQARWAGYLDHPMCNLRAYFTQIPAKWSDSKRLSAMPANSRVVFSFKSAKKPSDVTAFERSRPKGTTCYGVYFHEPEDNFTTPAAQATYRKNWQAYGKAIRDGGCTPTLILMRWTLQDKHRTWTSWYPGSAVDVVAWDAYNSGRHNDTYESPAKILDPIKAISAQIHKPWGIGETGSPIVKGDTGGQQRCRWAAAMRAEILKDGNARFALWWDSVSKDGKVDYQADRCDARQWTKFH